MKNRPFKLKLVKDEMLLSYKKYKLKNMKHT